jgi:hypothetical protein
MVVGVAVLGTTVLHAQTANSTQPHPPQRMKNKSMTSKRQACRWSSGVRHLGVAVLGVAVLGTAVLGVAVLGTVVLHPQPAFIRTAFDSRPTLLNA